MLHHVNFLRLYKQLLAEKASLLKILFLQQFLRIFFPSGMHIMVTGVLLQSTEDIPFIKANRISELPAKCMDKWLTEVETFQRNLSLNR